MTKVKVEICTGTACFVMGAAVLIEEARKIAAEHEGQVDVEAAVCCGLCRNWDEGKPPVMTVDGKVIAAADREKLVAAVKSALEGGD